MNAKSKNSRDRDASNESTLSDSETISKMSDYFRQPNQEELLNYIALRTRDPHAEILGFREKDESEKSRHSQSR